MRYCALLIILLAFFNLQLFAQRPQTSAASQAQVGSPKPGIITGTIISTESQKPVEFAAIALFNSGDSLINGAITTNKGNFRLDNIPFGVFRLEVSFIGFKTLRKDSILLSSEKPYTDLGKLLLAENVELLNEVEVVGEKRMVEMAIDKKVFNVEKNITSAGGSATDVLQNIPSVSVDIDGNVSLRGSGNITVLVDGKPSGLTGAGKTAILQQIPASSIESIEVITNPSVKYDPDGMSGIINIVLKKNRKKGANGSISAGIGTGDKYNASANLNFRNSKMNAYGNYSFRYHPINGEGTMLRENFFTDSLWYLNQYSDSRSKTLSHAAKTGIDFYLNEQNTLGLSAAFTNRTDPDMEKVEYQNLNSEKQLTDVTLRNNKEEENSQNIDLGANYKHDFKRPKQSLTADLAFSNASEISNEEYSQQYFFGDYSVKPTDPDLEKTMNDEHFRVTTIQSDYVHPLKEKLKFETGYKSIIRNIENTFSFQRFTYPSNDWQSDSLRNFHYTFNEQVHAGYGTFAGSSGKLSYQLGLRLEQAYTSSAQLLLNTVNKNQYFSVFPGGHFSYQQGKSGEIQLSYSKRINRPSVGSLVAFTDYDDPMNIRVGNPDLKPEYIHSLELSYALNKEKHTLTSSVYYRKIVDMIQRFRTVDPETGIALIRFENYAGATNTGFEFVARNEFFKWWNITSNVNVFMSFINASNLESDLHSEGFGWMAKLTSNFYLPAGFQMQISGGYRAPMPMTLGTMNAMYGADAAVKKEIFKGMGSLNLSVSDIFNTRQFGMDIVQPGYHHYFVRKRETRIATLNFTYKFGKGDSRQKQKQRGDNENMQMREEMF